jgi:minor extracellular serine protease Vpr
MTRGRLSALAFTTLTVLLAVGVGTGLAGGRPTDGGSAPTVDAGSALVQLDGAPLATSGRTKPAKGKKIDFSSSTVRSYRAQLNQLRNDFKQWLRQNAPGARVNGEFDIALNAVSVELNGTPLATIAAAPMVQSAQLQGLYRPAGHDDPDLELIHAFEAWGDAGGTPAAKGANVEVAVIDSGIDTRHPCFGSGPSNGGTNAKVTFAGVFHMKAKNQGYTPADLNGHGTHVAGTVACNEHTPATTDGVDIPYDPSGVAPAAKLGNFNVFPADVASARSEDIVDALEEAYERGFDVANMSLSGGQGGVNDLLAKAVDNLDAANMVIAVAAGNEGPGFSTVGSPAIAPGALAAGAATVGHFVGVEVTRGAVTARAAAGDFETVEADLTLPVSAPAGPGVAGLSQGCSAFPAGSMTDRIALIARGVCTFETKIRNAGTAGADAVLVVNNVGGDPIAMGDDTAIPGLPATPAYMVSQSDGTALVGAAGNATIEAARTYFLTGNDNIMAGFSGQGPTDVDLRVKPDVVAPGVNVLSSQPNGACETPPCWAFFQGTSMATPHLAGAAAVVRSQHPTWSSADIRSAIVNTADQGVLLNSTGTGVNANVNIIGAGRANALSSVNASVALDPVSVSFGSVPSGAGQSSSKTIALTTLAGAGPYTVAVTDETGLGADFGATISGSTITVTMTANRGIAGGNRQGILRVSLGGTEIAHAAIYAFVK